MVARSWVVRKTGHSSKVWLLIAERYGKTGQWRRSPRLRHQITRDAFAGMTLDIHQFGICLPAKAMAIASALSGDGKPRLRMSLDSILIRPAGVDAPLDRAKLSGELVIIRVDVDLTL